MCPHYVWSQCGLEVQQNTDGRYLLQPLAAGLLAVFLVLASVVKPWPQCCQQLLGQRAQSTRRRLAEDHIPSQLQRCVWCCRAGKEEMIMSERDGWDMVGQWAGEGEAAQTSQCNLSQHTWPVLTPTHILYAISLKPFKVPLTSAICQWAQFKETRASYYH